MSKFSADQILHRLREMFGEDRARIVAGDRFRVVDEPERVVAFPHNIEELSEILTVAQSERWRVIPAGAGTWLTVGNRPVQFQLVVSTAKMNRVLEYEPADLTATLQAGCSLAEFNQQAAQHRQFIPLDPFGSTDATIGGVIASASSGTLRCAYGTPRDWVVGTCVVHPNGGVTRAGGKVVKNVAGYDLNKLYAGSFGSLAVIAELSFKLRALPATEKTLVFYSDNAENLFWLALRLSDSDVQPTAMELISPVAELNLPLEPRRFALALRFLNEAETVDFQLKEAARLGHDFDRAVLIDAEAEIFWTRYHETETDDRWAFSLRLSALPADLNDVVKDVSNFLPQASWRAHAGNGVLRVFAKDDLFEGLQTKRRPKFISELRQLTQARGGQLVMLEAPQELKDQLDIWGDVGTTSRLMRELKNRFDPESQLSPGRFVGGI
ncbi:MAG: FAD-binding oxidoreductase [Blastocatellia bacterium]